MSLTAELCFLGSPHGVILGDGQTLAGPEGKQRHNSSLMVISWTLIWKGPTRMNNMEMS